MSGPVTATIPWKEIHQGGPPVVVEGMPWIQTNQAQDVVTVPSEYSILQSFKGWRGTKLIVTSSIIKVADHAFDGCYNLKEIVGMTGVTYVGDYSFNLCESLESFPYWQNLTHVGKYAFSKSAIRATDIFTTNVQGRAFALCDQLVCVCFGSLLQVIEEYAFQQCPFKYIQIPKQTTTLKQGCFYGCTLLTNITINKPKGSLDVSNCGFTPAQIASIVWTGSDPSDPIGPIDYGYVQADKTATDVVVPSTYKRIADNGFSGCAVLRSVTLPDSITRIGNNAFNGCGALVQINMPTLLVQIGNGAFIGTALVDVQLMEAIEFIGEGAFSNIGTLKSSTLRGIEHLGVPQCGNNIFAQKSGNPSTVAVSVYATYGDSRTKQLETKLAATTTWFNPPYVPPVPPPLDNVYFVNDTERATSTTLTISSTHNPPYKTIHDVKNCVALRRLYIPASIDTIDDNAFVGSSELAQIFIEGSSATSPLAKYFVAAQSGKQLGRQNKYVVPVLSWGGPYKQPSTTGLADWQIAQIVWSNDPKPSGTFLVADTSIKHLVVAEGYTQLSTSHSCPLLVDAFIPTTLIGFADYQFLGCIALNRVAYMSDIDNPSNTTPILLNTIPKQCFCGCVQLKSIQCFGGYASVKSGAFQGAGLEHLTLQPQVTQYESQCFASNAGLVDVVFNYDVASVTFWGVGLFSQCTNLKSITLNSKRCQAALDSFGINQAVTTVTWTKEIGVYYQNDINAQYVVIPDQYTSISDNCFVGCSKLISVQIPATIVSVGSLAFNIGSQQQLQQLIINKPSGSLDFSNARLSNPVAKDGIVWAGTDWNGYDGYIQFDKSVTSVDIPEGIQNIACAAFCGCKNLQTVHLPISLTNIRSTAFANTQLTTLQAYHNLQSVGHSAFYGVPFYTATTQMPHTIQINVQKANATSLIAQLASSGLVQAVLDTIGWREDGYTQLDKTAITPIVEEGYTSILPYGFQTSVARSVQLPQSLINIGTEAFSQCPQLTQLTLPSGVKNVGDRICKQCPALQLVTIENPNGFVQPYGVGLFSQPVGQNALKQINAQGMQTQELTNAFGIDPAVTTIIWDASFVGFDATTDLQPGTTRDTVSQISVYGTSARGDPFTYIHDIKNCSVLCSLFIGNGVISIDDKALTGCPNLSHIVVDNFQINLSMGKSGLAQWQLDQIQWLRDPLRTGIFQINDKQVTHLVVPDGFQTFVGTDGCENLASVELPKSITGFQPAQFAGCLNLTYIQSYTAKVVTPQQNQYNRLSITNFAVDLLFAGIIPDNCFFNCSSLKTFDTNVIRNYTRIGMSSFQGCNSLTRADVGTGCTNIGAYAFAFCTALTTLSLPDSLKMMGGYVVDSDTAITSIKIYQKKGVLDISPLAPYNTDAYIQWLGATNKQARPKPLK